MTDKWGKVFKMAKDLAGRGHLEASIREISEGDRYHYEQGEAVAFKIAGIAYEIGYCYTTEDDDDWAQAECYELSWTLRGEERITPDEMIEAIESAKQIERDNMISSLGI